MSRREAAGGGGRGAVPGGGGAPSTEGEGLSLEGTGGASMDRRSAIEPRGPLGAATEEDRVRGARDYP